MTEELAPAPAEQSPIVEAPVEATPEPTAEAHEPSGSSREALERAFAKMDVEADTTSNETTVDPQEGDRPRGPDGKFVAKDPENTPAEAKEAAPEAKATQDETSKPDAAFSDAPSRFSPDAKSAWKDAPKAVQAEIHRAVQEMEAGLAKKDEALRPIQPFIDMAAKSGTTVQKALQSYTAIDGMLRQDPARGFAMVAQSVGLTPQQVVGLLSGQGAGEADPRDKQILDLRQEIDGLKNGLGQVNTSMQQQTEHTMQAQVTEFAKNAPRFDELSPEIARLLETGYADTLPKAYEIAERLNPVLTPEPSAPTPAAQPRAAKSVTGAPFAGSTPVTTNPSKSPRDALSRAFAATGLT